MVLKKGNVASSKPSIGPAVAAQLRRWAACGTRVKTKLMKASIFLLAVNILVLPVIGQAQAQTSPIEPQPSHVQFEIFRAESWAAPGTVETKIYGRKDSVYVHKEVELDIRDVKDAKYITDEYGRPAIEISLTKKGRLKMSALIKVHLHRPLAIFLDGKLIMAPLVDSPTLEDQLTITGEIQESEARRIVSRLKAK